MFVVAFIMSITEEHSRVTKAGILDSEYFDRPQLAIELHVTIRTVSRLTNRPDFVPSVLVGGRRYFRISAVRQWLLKQEANSAPRSRRRRRNRGAKSRVEYEVGQ